MGANSKGVRGGERTTDNAAGKVNKKRSEGRLQTVCTGGTSANGEEVIY